MYGYNGKFLVVNMACRQARWEPLGEDVLRNFIGGTGLATYLLHHFCPTGIDPTDPSNPLIFATSPLVGSRLTTSSKFAVATKSPLTRFIGDSLSSSFLSTELKRSGLDGLVITGRASSLTLLFINNGKVEFLDASNLKGLTTSMTEKTVKERLGHRTRVACIGPAGEELIPYASIANDGGRQAGRTGSGAVMGSKNLKAIAVIGTQAVPFSNPDGLKKVGSDLSKRSLGDSTEKYRVLGTMANMAVFNRLGTLPTRNFQQSTFEGAEQVSGEIFHQKHKVGNAHCANCTIGCEHIVATNDHGPNTQGRMEYESSFALGPLVGISNPNSIIRASQLCDELGMDTISTGGTISWAMECFEKGILTKNDTGGMDLRFGNEDAVMECIRLIPKRLGIGKLLSKGSRDAATTVGQGSEHWAMHVKGLEMPGYEPRSLQTMALGLAVSTRGACHNRSSAYDSDFSSKIDRLSADKERGRLTMEGEDFSSVLDSLIWCKFLRKTFVDFYEESSNVYQLITGWPMSPSQLMEAGERISNLKKQFNIREGWQRGDDTLPQRILDERLPTGVTRGVGLSHKDLDMMISTYYKERGWTSKGMIPNSKLTELGLIGLVRQ